MYLLLFNSNTLTCSVILQGTLENVKNKEKQITKPAKDKIKKTLALSSSSSSLSSWLLSWPFLKIYQTRAPLCRLTLNQQMLES